MNLKGAPRFIDLFFVLKNKCERPRSYVYFYELIVGILTANYCILLETTWNFCIKEIWEKHSLASKFELRTLSSTSSTRIVPTVTCKRDKNCKRNIKEARLLKRHQVSRKQG